MVWYVKSQNMLHHRSYQTQMFILFFVWLVGFLRGGECSRGGGNWGTLRIPREDWGTLGNIGEDSGITTPLKNPTKDAWKKFQKYSPKWQAFSW